MPKKLTNDEQRRQPLRCGRLVGVRLSLTREEIAALLGLVRDAANEPSDVDFPTLLSLCGKVEKATAHLNAKVSNSGVNT